MRREEGGGGGVSRCGAGKRRQGRAGLRAYRWVFWTSREEEPEGARIFGPVERAMGAGRGALPPGCGCGWAGSVEEEEVEGPATGCAGGAAEGEASCLFVGLGWTTFGRAGREGGGLLLFILGGGGDEARN